MPTIVASHATRSAKGHFFGVGIVISLLLHALIGATLINAVHWPLAEFEEQHVEVVLVPPPEAPKPEATVPEKPEPAPEPEPEPEQKLEAEESPPPEKQVAKEAVSIPVLQPVIEFGETDSGPEEAREGDAAQEPDEPDAEVTEPSADQLKETLTAETEPSEDLEGEAVQSPGALKPQGPEAALEPKPEPGSAPVAASEPEDFGTVGPIASLAPPTPKPASRPVTRNRDAAWPDSGRAKAANNVLRLYSAGILSDRRTQTAMAEMLPSERLNLLCMTELRAQLRADNPQNPPELLPRFRPRGGTVLQPKQAAFRSGGQWYDVAFRCKVDDRVTRVQEFSFAVGRAVPRAEWAERGFPRL